MPRIQTSDGTFEIEDCKQCNRTVFKREEGVLLAGMGFIANCGRRLVNLNDCRMEPCVNDEPDH